MTTNYANRTPWMITRAVWHAMFLREALSRTTGDRLAWFWMLAEPFAMIAVMVAIRGVAMSQGPIFGADFIPWMVAGMLGFFLFRDNMLKSIGAISANKGLFTYRQVKPVDAVLVRCFVEGTLKSFVFLLFIIAASLLQIDLIPSDPLLAIFCWLSLWILGAGFGLALSALSTLVPEVGRIVRIITLPLLIISGVIMPLQLIPYKVQHFLLLNPIVHGLEALRLAFFEGYHSLNGISLIYLWCWSLSLWLLGLILHIRFEQRLKAA